MTRPIVSPKTSVAEAEGRLAKNFGIGRLCSALVIVCEIVPKTVQKTVVKPVAKTDPKPFQKTGLKTVPKTVQIIVLKFY